jgi:CheY-like chemotaxis protein
LCIIDQSSALAFNPYFPNLEDIVEREKMIEAKTLNQPPGTILLVDDEKMVIDVGQAMLEKLGYRVLRAQNGREAVDAITAHDDAIDLVILDMIMPGLSGAEVFDRIRETNPDLPVILSSGYSLDGQATRIMNKGCNGFIQKPFSLPELSQIIQKTLKMPAR